MKKLSRLLLLLLALALVAGCSPSSLNNRVTPVSTSATEFFNYQDVIVASGEILIRTRAGVDLQTIAAACGSEVLKTWENIDWAVISVPSGKDPIAFAKALRSKTGVLLAEPNMRYELDAVPTVADYSDQWGFKTINAEKAWDITIGDSNVIVAIVDTGVDLAHPEFEDKEFVDPYDATGENDPTQDYNGHGTHVAGISADDGRSGKIAGVAWNCPIMPVRVQNASGTIYTSYLIEAMIHLAEWAAQHPSYRVVANMSIGGRAYSFAFKDAIDYAAENGVLLVTSAGNNYKRILSYPGAYNGVVSVAACDAWSKKTYFSTSGYWVSVAAPGIDILSTYKDGVYDTLQGTSMASPFVCGAAALLLSRYPGLTPLQIKNQIEQTAQASKFTEELGYGVIDLQAMLSDLQAMIYGTLEVRTNLVEDDQFVGTGVITIHDLNGRFVTCGTTGHNGNHRFHAMKPGSYRVYISYQNLLDGNYDQYTKTVKVTADDITTADFQISVPHITRTEFLSQEIREDDGSIEVPFTVTTEAHYEMVTSLLDSTCDTTLTLKDASGNVLAFNDDYSGTYSCIILNLPAGNYTLVVAEYSGYALNCLLTINQLITN